ncbi:hypothetical protein H0H92_008116 [Tricholoma furcatifolium]|nr:hypothetical protein H0H92_008116 [Tricholoma furcatifolium]
MPNQIEAELSLRHFPASDASFSFQIPNSIATSDYLLDADDPSFLQGADANPTPGPSRIASSTLFLHDLAPMSSSKHETSLATSLEPTRVHGPESKSESPKFTNQNVETRVDVAKGKLKESSNKAVRRRTRTTVKDKSSATTNLEAVRALLDNDPAGSSTLAPPTNICEPLHDDKPGLSNSKQEVAIMKSKRQTVVSGGVTKTRSKNAVSWSKMPRNVASVPAIQQQPFPAAPQSHVLSDNAVIPVYGNPDTSCDAVSGGVAERLVMYSQKFLTSSGTNPAPSIQTQNFTPDSDTAHQAGDVRYEPLTLSQLSPSKAAVPRATSLEAVSPSSPMRRSGKRPAPESTVSSEPKAKKGRRLAAASNDAMAVVPPATRGAGSSSSSSRSTSQSTIRTASQRTRSTRGASKRVRQEHAPTASTTVHTSQIDVPATFSRSNASSSSSSGPTDSRPDELSITGSSVPMQREAGSSRNKPRHQDRFPTNPTRSVGFKFQVDARIEARKAELEKERLLSSQKAQKSNHRQVPDFKALHAAQEAKLAQLKENIVPVVPLPLHLNTDERVRERGKFEDHLREKERELERVMEQKRREREEIEEREIREMRKKAVPKANEVPEWYKDVPKRKMKDHDSNRG